MGKNKKELGHIGYKISAVLLAIVAWLAVANISDYQTTRQISNIPVTQINGDVLDELESGVRCSEWRYCGYHSQGQTICGRYT